MSKVMLVDDDHSTVKLLKMLLELDGFDVVVSPSGETAFEQAKEAKPDVFLIDYHLSDSTSGADVVRQLRADKQFASTPVIMTSGLDRTEDAMDAGASEFLIKPFEPNDLSALLRTLLGV